MAFNTSQLETVASKYSTELAVKAVTQAKTAQLLISNKSLQAGVKGSADISKLSNTIIFQDGKGCGFTDLGETILSNKKIEVQKLKINDSLCYDAVYDTYFASMLAQGADPETETLSEPFLKAILDDKVTLISVEIEKLLWQGDKSLTGSNNLKWIDGLLKQISTASDKINATPTGSPATIIEKLQGVFAKMPVAVRKSPDFRIFIGEDMHDEYLMVLASKNIYKPTDDMILFGTSAKLEVVPGLNDTHKVIAAKISDLHLGLDGTDDADKIRVNYDLMSREWKLACYFAVGVSTVYTSQIGYVDFSV